LAMARVPENADFHRAEGRQNGVVIFCQSETARKRGLCKALDKGTVVGNGSGFVGNGSCKSVGLTRRICVSRFSATGRSSRFG
jgi:hypothetical protein